MAEYFNDILSKYHQSGLRKGFSSQHCLLVLIEKWKKILDNVGSFEAL